tara:strand:+ start:88 stop:252 length:165 start_codon:yes stop_codon:yes gene_type:complete
MAARESAIVSVAVGGGIGVGTGNCIGSSLEQPAKITTINNRNVAGTDLVDVGSV